MSISGLNNSLDRVEIETSRIMKVSGDAKSPPIPKTGAPGLMGSMVRDVIRLAVHARLCEEANAKMMTELVKRNLVEVKFPDNSDGIVSCKMSLVILASEKV